MQVSALADNWTHELETGIKHRVSNRIDAPIFIHLFTYLLMKIHLFIFNVLERQRIKKKRERDGKWVGKGRASVGSG